MYTSAVAAAKSRLDGVAIRIFSTNLTPILDSIISFLCRWQITLCQLRLGLYGCFRMWDKCSCGDSWLISALNARRLLAQSSTFFTALLVWQQYFRRSLHSAINFFFSFPLLLLISAVFPTYLLLLNPVLLSNIPFILFHLLLLLLLPFLKNNSNNTEDDDNNSNHN